MAWRQLIYSSCLNFIRQLIMLIMPAIIAPKGVTFLSRNCSQKNALLGSKKPAHDSGNESNAPHTHRKPSN